VATLVGLPLVVIVFNLVSVYRYRSSDPLFHSLSFLLPLDSSYPTYTLCVFSPPLSTRSRQQRRSRLPRAHMLYLSTSRAGPSHSLPPYLLLPIVSFLPPADAALGLMSRFGTGSDRDELTSRTALGWVGRSVSSLVYSLLASCLLLYPIVHHTLHRVKNWGKNGLKRKIGVYGCKGR